MKALLTSLVIISLIMLGTTWVNLKQLTAANRQMGEHSRQINSIESELATLKPAPAEGVTKEGKTFVPVKRLPEKTEVAPTETSTLPLGDTLVGPKGGKYIMVISKKTGKLYKKYIK